MVSSGLGAYGHWLGVSWIWVAGIILVHVLFSMSIPILLLDLGIPATRGQSFLSGRRIVAAFAVLGLDVVLLFSLVYFGQKFYMGDGILAGSILAMCTFILLARATPANVPPARPSPQERAANCGAKGSISPAQRVARANPAYSAGTERPAA